ncbi:MAG: YybH family protein, partial [Actinomycetes bacterium]
FLAAFNAGDTAALDQLYEPDGVLVPRPGFPTTGPGRAAANGWLLGLGLPMQAQVRHSDVAGDIALLVVDWRVQGTGPDGAAVDLSGTATDVVRRGGDGTWRYVIDNPQGCA